MIKKYLDSENLFRRSWGEGNWGVGATRAFPDWETPRPEDEAADGPFGAVRGTLMFAYFIRLQLGIFPAVFGFGLQRQLFRC